MFARNLTVGVTQSKLCDSEANCGATRCNLRRDDYLHGIRYKRRDSLFESREIRPVCLRSCIGRRRLCVHTRLPHSFKENAGRAKREREEGVDRARLGLFSFPGHRQNKYPAIFAMHLLLPPLLSLSLFSFFFLFFPSARSRSLSLLCTVSRYLFTLSFVPYRHRDRPCQRTPTTQYILYILSPVCRVPECAQGVPELSSHLSFFRSISRSIVFRRKLYWIFISFFRPFFSVQFFSLI